MDKNLSRFVEHNIDTIVTGQDQVIAPPLFQCLWQYVTSGYITDTA